ncbi:MAG TPA: hypothetical protein VGP22_04835 [Albitalea sp.]|jgi:hypothetical protein|nr:hypothetical protein [Albitalea sp.]
MATRSDKPHGEPGGHRSPAGTDYGDFVPDSGQPRRNDDLDADPIAGDFETGHDDPMHIPKRPGSPRPRSDKGQSGTVRTGVLGEPDGPPQPDESAATESNRNKSFDTPHVHSGTTPRKV